MKNLSPAGPLPGWAGEMVGWIRRALADAARTFTWEPQRSGIGLAVALGRMGVRGWGWGVLLAGTLLVGFGATLPGMPDRARGLLETPLGSGGLALWLPFLWTLLVATAVDLPVAFRLLIAVYSLYYFGLPLLAAPSPTILLIPALALFLYEGLWPASAMRGWPGRLLWALALAQFPPHPLRPLGLSVAAKALIGVGIAALLARIRRPLPRMARGGGLWVGLGLPFWIAWSHDPQGLREGMGAALNGLWAFSVPLWLWLGANLVEDGARLGGFWARRTELFQRAPHMLRRLPILPLLLGLLGLPAFWPEIVPFPREGFWIPVFAVYGPLWRLARGWTADLYLAARTIVVLWILLGLAGLWMARRMEPGVFGARYVALTVGAGAFVLAFWQAYFGVLDLDLPQQWWPLFLVALAWFWEPLKGLRELTEEAEDLLEWICAAALVLLSAVMFRMLQDPEGLVRETGLWPLLGAAAWGLPALLFSALQTARREDAEETVSPVRPFLAGYAGMLPLATLVPVAGPWLPPLALLLIETLLPAAGSRWARAQHAAWIGLGAVGFLVAPWILPLPVLPLTGWGLERLYARPPLAFLGTAHLLLAGGALLATLPIAWGEGSRGRRWLGRIAGAAMWLAWNRAWGL